MYKKLYFAGQDYVTFYTRRRGRGVSSDGVKSYTRRPAASKKLYTIARAGIVGGVGVVGEVDRQALIAGRGDAAGRQAKTPQGCAANDPLPAAPASATGRYAFTRHDTRVISIKPRHGPLRASIISCLGQYTRFSTLNQVNCTKSFLFSISRFWSISNRRS